MKRILNAYDAKIRALLTRIGARQIQKGVTWMFRRAEKLRGEGMEPSDALESVYQAARQRVARALPRTHRHERPVEFVCDVGLGGLARWLRAAGYMAYWREGVEDPELIEEARARSAILLTTDSGMMERKVLRDGHLPAIWLSPGLTKLRQLESVLNELELPRLEPRCMDCGGELMAVDKKSLAGRIPPRTYLWRDDYFVCQSCGKLFWHGSHWRRIDQALAHRPKKRDPSELGSP